MSPQRVLLFKFLLGTVVAFALLCAGFAWFTMRVIWWTISNCGQSTGCAVGSWWIDFWWLPFLVIVLGATVALRRVFDRLVARLG